MASIQTYLTGLVGNLEKSISMGPMTFFTNEEGKIEAQVEANENNDQFVQEASHLLFFSANAHKIYYDLKHEPGSISFNEIDPYVFQACQELLRLRLKQDHPPWAGKALQTMKYFHILQEEKNKELWKEYLFLGIGFETLFSLNPSYPSADLRQHLRPLLHLKFSHPVELLWKWVDQFYHFRNSILQGDLHKTPYFTENPDIKPLLHVIGEKLLIYSIYDYLFKKELIQGHIGKANIPDDFSFIHPERVLVYFWSLGTLEKKITLLQLQASESEDLNMLLKIQEMHRKIHKKT